jgi:ribosomal protein S18 acetylase RimI-like enzyme
MPVPTTSFARATLGDAPAILTLQRLAYRSEAELYGDPTIPPLVQTLAELEDDLRCQVVIKGTEDGVLVASARGYERDGTAYIGRVIVHPAWQGRGLGKRTMAAIEAELAGARRFELFTGHLSTRNLAFYRGLGYRDFKTVTVTTALSFVYLEKSAR